MAREWDELQQDARNELRARFKAYPGEFNDGEAHDVIFEMADGMVPVYNYDRFALLADPQLSGREISDPGLLPENGALVELVGVYIFDALEEALWDEWREMEREQDEDGDED